jgi:hypothetical protein
MTSVAYIAGWPTPSINLLLEGKVGGKRKKEDTCREAPLAEPQQEPGRGVLKLMAIYLSSVTYRR